MKPNLNGKATEDQNEPDAIQTKFDPSVEINIWELVQKPEIQPLSLDNCLFFDLKYWPSEEITRYKA